MFDFQEMNLDIVLRVFLETLRLPGPTVAALSVVLDLVQKEDVLQTCIDEFLDVAKIADCYHLDGLLVSLSKFTTLLLPTSVEESVLAFGLLPTRLARDATDDLEPNSEPDSRVSPLVVKLTLPPVRKMRLKYRFCEFVIMIRKSLPHNLLRNRLKRVNVPPKHILDIAIFNSFGGTFTRFNLFLRSSGDRINNEMFAILSGPTVAALSVVLDLVEQEDVL
nr:ARF guanine-nucleotide exchange factor GNOM-like [Tanacetum cinerariifolium]